MLMDVANCVRIVPYFQLRSELMKLEFKESLDIISTRRKYESSEPESEGREHVRGGLQEGEDWISWRHISSFIPIAGRGPALIFQRVEVAAIAFYMVLMRACGCELKLVFCFIAYGYCYSQISRKTCIKSGCTEFCNSSFSSSSDSWIGSIGRICAHVRARHHYTERCKCKFAKNMNNFDCELVDGRPSLLAKDELLAGRCRVSEKVGQGSFGPIYKGSDKMKNRAVAIKVEPVVKKGDKVNDPRRLVLEQNVLIALRKKSNIPRIYASGRTNKGYPYIIMQMLGNNLTDLRKMRAEKRFTPSTAFRIAEQVTVALQHLHEASYIHRDVKPTNCCIGAVPDVKKVYLIDFGMCRRFCDDNGKWRPFRKKAPFKGTIRYASLNALRSHDCGPVDDLIGWLYSCIEIALSKLPWAKSTPREMLRMKEEMKAEEVCAQMPEPFIECYTYISQLSPKQFPEHIRMHNWLRECRPPNTKTNDPFHWETEHLV